MPTKQASVVLSLCVFLAISCGYALPKNQRLTTEIVDWPLHPLRMIGSGALATGV
jgi:uncharacterized protein YjeT (DUF2065 family)